MRKRVLTQGAREIPEDDHTEHDRGKLRDADRVALMELVTCFVHCHDVLLAFHYG